jgi:enoyl-CoA hydratase/carnithine racemase
MARDIAVEVADDGVATLTLARPERRNALSIGLRDEIAAQLKGWASDPAVRVVVLTGSGSSFCAGFDLDEFAQADLAAGSGAALAATTLSSGRSPSRSWPL